MGSEMCIRDRSLGVTDSEGRYELSTKDGSYGAVAGQHTVTFTYDDLDDMGDLKAWLSTAEDEADAAKAKAKIEHVKSEIEKRGAISSSSKQTISVPEDGKEGMDFEVGDKKE